MTAAHAQQRSTMAGIFARPALADENAGTAVYGRVRNALQAGKENGLGGAQSAFSAATAGKGGQPTLTVRKALGNITNARAGNVSGGSSLLGKQLQVQQHQGPLQKQQGPQAPPRRAFGDITNSALGNAAAQQSNGGSLLGKPPGSTSAKQELGPQASTSSSRQVLPRHEVYASDGVERLAGRGWKQLEAERQQAEEAGINTRAALVSSVMAAAWAPSQFLPVGTPDGPPPEPEGWPSATRMPPSVQDAPCSFTHPAVASTSCNPACRIIDACLHEGRQEVGFGCLACRSFTAIPSQRQTHLHFAVSRGLWHPKVRLQPSHSGSAASCNRFMGCACRHVDSQDCCWGIPHALTRPGTKLQDLACPRLCASVWRVRVRAHVCPGTPMHGCCIAMQPTCRGTATATLPWLQDCPPPAQHGSQHWHSWTQWICCQTSKSRPSTSVSMTSSSDLRAVAPSATLCCSEGSWAASHGRLWVVVVRTHMHARVFVCVCGHAPDCQMHMHQHGSCGRVHV